MRRLAGSVLVVFFVFGGVAVQAVDWQQEVDGGLNDTDNTTVNVLAPFNGILFAGILSGTDRAEVWARMNVGGSWAWTVLRSSGFGDLQNYGVTSMTAYGSAMYFGTFNFTTGCEIWYTTNGTNFYQTHADGLGYAATNTDATSMEVYDGKLFVGTSNSAGLQVHEYDGAIWRLRVIGGFGGYSDNTSVTCMTVHDGALYAGTYNNDAGGEIWKSDDGVVWARVLQGGFGTDSIDALESIGGGLYAAVAGANGAEVYLIGDAFNIQVNTDGFGNVNNTYISEMVFYNGAFVALVSRSSGFEILRKAGHTTWESIVDSELATAQTSGAHELTFFGNSLFLGTDNAFGAEIWMLPPIFADDFESGGDTAWSDTVP